MHRDATTGIPIVAMVSSMGGLAALRTVLATLPADFPGAVVVLRHLDPARISILPTLLAPSCVMPVSAAVDGQVLRPGTVVVAPPACHTLIGPELTVALVRSGAFPPSRPSADLMLTSLALTAGSAAIAVVLTGLGHDGATGVSVIKRFGGRVFASDQATSQEFSMPSAAIEREQLDAVLPLTGLGAALIDATTPGDVG